MEHPSKSVLTRLLFIGIFLVNEGLVWWYASPKQKWAIFFHLIIMYLLLYLTWNNLQRSVFNKTIVVMFVGLYAFFIIWSSGMGILIHIQPGYYEAFYILSEIVVSFLLLWIALYLVLYSFHILSYSVLRILFSLFLAGIIIGFFYRTCLFTGCQGLENFSLSQFYQLDYQAKLLALILLLVFWIRYQKEYVALSEYLGLVIFLFMLGVLIDVIFFAVNPFVKEHFWVSYFISLLLNVLTAGVWYLRWKYLESPRAVTNERYLQNIRILRALAPKPDPNFLDRLCLLVSSHLWLFLLLVVFIVGLLVIFVHNISTFLFWNLILVFLLTVFSIVFAVVALRKEWEKQFFTLTRQWRKRKL